MIIARIVSNCEHGIRLERNILRGRKGGWERIGVSDIGITKCPWRSSYAKLRAKGCNIDKSIIVSSRKYRVIEYTRTSAKAGLTISCQIIGKTDTRCKIVVAAVGAPLGNSGVAWEEQARRSIYIDLRMNSCIIVGGVKLLSSKAAFFPREKRVIANAQVYS